MKEMKRATTAATEHGSKVSKPLFGSAGLHTHLYYITWFMALTTLIAAWHIKDVWGGIVTMMCGIVTIILTAIMIGGNKDVEHL